MVGHRRGGWGETGYLCLVPSAKLHLPIFFLRMLQPEYNQPGNLFFYNTA